MRAFRKEIDDKVVANRHVVSALKCKQPVSVRLPGVRGHVGQVANVGLIEVHRARHALCIDGLPVFERSMFIDVCNSVVQAVSKFCQMVRAGRDVDPMAFWFDDAQ